MILIKKTLRNAKIGVVQSDFRKSPESCVFFLNHVVFFFSKQKYVAFCHRHLVEIITIKRNTFIGAAAAAAATQ